MEKTKLKYNKANFIAGVFMLFGWAMILLFLPNYIFLGLSALIVGIWNLSMVNQQITIRW